MRGEKDARNLTVDFTKLDMATLKRYKRHYRLKTRQNVTKTELALAVARHFAAQTGPQDERAVWSAACPRTFAPGLAVSSPHPLSHSLAVDEADTISLFMYSARAGSLHYDRRDYLVR